MRKVFWAMLMLILPGLAWAGPALSPAMTDWVRTRPDDFTEQAAALLFGHGIAGRFDAAAADRAVALERARLRQRELRRLLLADLDDDGAVNAAELAVLMQAEGAGPRGRLAVSFARTDADGDGVVQATELALAARQVAVADSAPLADLAAAVLACDLDGDGAVDLPELRRAVALLASGA